MRSHCCQIALIERKPRRGLNCALAGVEVKAGSGGKWSDMATLLISISYHFSLKSYKRLFLLFIDFSGFCTAVCLHVEKHSDMKVHQQNDKTGKRAIISKQTLASFPRLHLNIIMVAATMMIATSGMAQRQEKVADFNNNRLANTTIQNINIVYNSGKVYINWMVKGEKVDGIYLVERSMDGKAFTAVGFKEVVASSLELLYSWIDNEPAQGNSFYRISRIGQNYEQEVMTASIPVLNIGSENKTNTASSANDTKTVK